MNEKNVDKEVGKHDQTQLKTPRRNVEGERKKIDNQAKKIRQNAALKFSAQN